MLKVYYPKVTFLREYLMEILCLPKHTIDHNLADHLNRTCDSDAFITLLNHSIVGCHGQVKRKLEVEALFMYMHEV